LVVHKLILHNIYLGLCGLVEQITDETRLDFQLGRTLKFVKEKTGTKGLKNPKNQSQNQDQRVHLKTKKKFHKGLKVPCIFKNWTTPAKTRYVPKCGPSCRIWDFILRELKIRTF
jgi:hypothetical protein